MKISVELVRKHRDPFAATNPWHVAQIHLDDVEEAIRLQMFNSSTYRPEMRWHRHQHVRRIAYLVLEGWKGCITINVGTKEAPRPKWSLVDGVHRLAAAIYRKDRDIEAMIIGDQQIALDAVNRFRGGLLKVDADGNTVVPTEPVIKRGGSH